jgi:hypothetical protein
MVLRARTRSFGGDEDLLLAEVADVWLSTPSDRLGGQAPRCVAGSEPLGK